MSSLNKEERLIDGYISRYALLYYVAILYMPTCVDRAI